jgi:hypothetical protein
MTWRTTPVTEPAPAKPKIFISYSHKDEGWKDKLRSHLGVIEKDRFNLWDDRRIQTGEDWY